MQLLSPTASDTRRLPLTNLPTLRAPCLPSLALPQSFFLHPPVDCAEGDVLAVEIDVVRRKDNQRLMDVKIQHRVEGKGKARTSCFHIE